MKNEILNRALDILSHAIGTAFILFPADKVSNPVTIEDGDDVREHQLLLSGAIYCPKGVTFRFEPKQTPGKRYIAGDWKEKKGRPARLEITTPDKRIIILSQPGVPKEIDGTGITAVYTHKRFGEVKDLTEIIPKDLI